MFGTSVDRKSREIGDIVIIPEEDQVTIGKLKNYNHPYIQVEGVSTVFSENIVYKADAEKLSFLGLDSRAVDDIMGGSATLPMIGKA